MLPQDVVGCVWSDMPSCTGEVITQWRAWVLQVASLETFLGICPEDYLDLQLMYDALPEDCKNTFSRPFCYLDIFSILPAVLIDQDRQFYLHRPSKESLKGWRECTPLSDYTFMCDRL